MIIFVTLYSIGLVSKIGAFFSGKGENIWDRICHTHPELITNRDNGDVAGDSYHKYKEDVALIKEIGVS